MVYRLANYPQNDLVIDASVRAELAIELGHKRSGVMNTYIGGD